ncbi:MAG: SRPBCC family protein [Flavobacteriales bacterium]|nr:SRPBCC family protein [Flavobacteriales bacterium]
MFHFKRTTIIPAKKKEVWDFFSSPENLSRITPEYLDFKIISKPDSEKIFDNMIIKYKVKPLLKIPVTWVTRIEEVKTEESFKDIQIKGPYAFWQHLHTFETVDGGVKMTDDVTYSPGLGIFNELINKFVVEKRLNEIFDFRQRVINTIFIKN